MWIGHSCGINFCYLFGIVNLSFFTLNIYRQWMFVVSATPLTLLKLCVCILHDMRMCMWFAYNCCINFCHFFPHGMRICLWIGHSCGIRFCYFFGIVNLVIFHPEYIDSGCLL